MHQHFLVLQAVLHCTTSVPFCVDLNILVLQAAFFCRIGYYTAYNTVHPLGILMNMAAFFLAAACVHVCVVLLRARWYHGAITREQANEILQGGEVGLFLVRESMHYQGDYTLCMVGPDAKIEHYRVLNRNNRLTVDEDDYFDTLNQLVKVGVVPLLPLEPLPLTASLSFHRQQGQTMH